MRSRGQGILTLVVVGLLVLAALAFDRLGERAPGGTASGTAASGTWLCPHGGGKSYEGTVYLANPGEDEVTARVTEIGPEGPGASSDEVIPAGQQVAVTVDASERGSSTFVETFGGWVAAGWLVRGAEGEVGVGAEPCAPAAARSWMTAAATTDEGEDSYLVVTNPFDTDAVFDVALFASDRAPVRDSELTDVTVRPRRSAAFRLNEFAQGEAGLGVSVQVSSGRVAVATLVVSEGRGIGSVIASPAASERHLMLTSTGAGRSMLAVSVPTVTDDGASPVPATQLGTTFSATLRSEVAPQPAGGLAEQTQEPESAASYPIPTTGASAVDVVVGDGSPIVTALRTLGVGNDGGATSGSSAPATAWVVTPTIAGGPARPGLLVLNPGQTEATVEIVSIPGDGTASASTSLTVLPGSVANVPRGFLDGLGDASFAVRSPDQPVVALGASTSLGNEGLSVYGLAAGVPIPGSGTP